MTLLLDTKFDKRKDQQIKGMGERTDNNIILLQCNDVVRKDDTTFS